jgi:hypothetical protein
MTSIQASEPDPALIDALIRRLDAAASFRAAGSWNGNG